MTGFGARRGAEEFNGSVEATSTGTPTDPRHADLLELVGALRATAAVEPRPDFVSGLREQLMTEAATVLTPTRARLTLAPRTRPTRTSRERRLAIAVGGFAVVSATASMAVASQSALPGDTLYPLKRALENASTTIETGQDDRAASLLDHASGRLQEVEALTRSAEDDRSSAVRETLNSFTTQASTASDLTVAAYETDGQASSVERLRDFTTQSMASLRDLESAVPEQARAALIEAVRVIDQIDATAAALCPTCGQGVGEVPVAATTAVGDLIDGLNARLPAAEADETDQAAPADRPRRHGNGRADGDEPGKTQVVDVPKDPIDTGAAGAAGAPARGTDPSVPTRDPVKGARNPIDTLSDGLTGGRDVRGPRGGGAGIGDAVEDTVGGLGDVLDDVLGGP